MKEAAVRIVLEDRKNNIRDEWEGEYGGVMLMNDEGLRCLFAGEASKKNVLVSMAAYVTEIIGSIANDEEERMASGIAFANVFGKMIVEERRPASEIRIDGWKEAEE